VVGVDGVEHARASALAIVLVLILLVVIACSWIVQGLLRRGRPQEYVGNSLHGTWNSLYTHTHVCGALCLIVLVLIIIKKP
jgi:ABC-type Fe3+ transport system permease subunit